MRTHAHRTLLEDCFRLQALAKPILWLEQRRGCTRMGIQPMGKPKSHEEQGLQTWPRVGSGRVGVGKLLPLPGNKLQNRADMTKWWVSILQRDSTSGKGAIEAML